MPPDIQAEMLMNPAMLKDMVCARVAQSLCTCVSQDDCCLCTDGTPSRSARPRSDISAYLRLRIVKCPCVS